MGVLNDAKKVIVERINPGLALDGGGVEIVSFKDGVLKVRLMGGCAGCPMRQLTLTNFIEKAIVEHVPEVTKVIAV